MSDKFNFGRFSDKFFIAFMIILISGLLVWWGFIHEEMSTAVLTLVGSWIGSIIGYYFGRIDK